MRGKNLAIAEWPVQGKQAADCVLFAGLVPVAKVTLAQLIDELNNPASAQAPGSDAGRSHAHDVLDLQWGVPPSQLHTHLHDLGPQGAADFMNRNTRLLVQLAEVKALMGTAYMPILSGHADELLVREQSWGPYAKPEDYLDSFGRFVHEQINQSVALATVVNRPKDLTREQLREVRLLLDAHGYSEAKLKAAWRHRSNLEIAAIAIAHGLTLVSRNTRDFVDRPGLQLANWFSD